MSTNNTMILAIDAEQSWLEFCEETLKINGYQVFTASTIQKAQQLLLTALQDKTVLILIDNNVFETDTILSEMLDSQKWESFWSVVVLFAIDLTPEKARQAFKKGVGDCVNKPYSEDDLLFIVEQMLAEQRLAHASHRPSKHSGSILIVDDEQDWVNTLKEYLSTQYFSPIKDITIEEALNYQSAIEKIQQHSFDCVIVDLRLVDDDDDNFEGMNLINFIRQHDVEMNTFTQIIIVSAYGTPEHIRQAYREFNIFYYFDKRYVSPDKYQDAIQEAFTVASSSNA